MAETIRELISEQDVDKRIEELGQEISRDYAGKSIHLICILKGGAFFMCELAKRITLPVSIDFMYVSSYGDATSSSGNIKIKKDLDESVEGKDVIILDDMISSGDSMLEVAKELKARKARRIFVFSTFGLFTSGLDKFDQAYEEGVIAKVLTTNLIYQTPELLKRPYYINCDMSKYIAYIIDTLNHDVSISELLDPYERIRSLVEKYQAGESIQGEN